MCRGYFYVYFMSYFTPNLRIQSECGKIGTRKTPNTDTFYAVRSVGSSIKTTADKTIIIEIEIRITEFSCSYFVHGHIFSKK